MRILVDKTNAVKDKESISSDTLLQKLKSKTLKEVTQYFDSHLSSLSNLTPMQIDAYIDNNVTNLSKAKDVLKVLAKDSAFTSRTLQTLAKAVIYLLKADKHGTRIAEPKLIVKDDGGDLVKGT